MVNRKKAPPVTLPTNLPLPSVEQKQLQGKLPLSIIRGEHPPLIVLTVTFQAGLRYTSKPGVAYLTAKMWTRGTAKRRAEDIAEQMEFYGAKLQAHMGADTLQLQLVTPATHFTQLLPIFVDVLGNPVFPVDELDKVKKIVHQQIKQRDADPSAQAQQQLKTQLFGSQHPYGYLLDSSSLATITHTELHAHYQQYAWNSPQLIISGSMTLDMHTALRHHFAPYTAKKVLPLPSFIIPGDSTLHIHRVQSAQSTIRIGQHTITLSNPDYLDYYITNELLGGYFGSRLMREIREKKGYTYGVYSRIVPQQEQGYWFVCTAVNPEHTEDTITTIKKEVEQLQETPVTPKELIKCQCYLLGECLGSFETPFDVHQQLQAVSLHGLNLNYYQQLYQAIQHITPATLQQAAQTYFTPERWHQVVISKVHV